MGQQLMFLGTRRTDYFEGFSSRYWMGSKIALYSTRMSMLVAIMIIRESIEIYILEMWEYGDILK